MPIFCEAFCLGGFHRFVAENAFNKTARFLAAFFRHKVNALAKQFFFLPAKCFRESRVDVYHIALNVVNGDGVRR